MQDIVFYAAANETLGIVRDYANVRNQSAPTLVLGVSARLRMRLFADSESTAPYPVSAFDGISDWKWRMDADFDRNTPGKLVADTGNISVRTVTDTVNGESATFTEFAIPISDMNTVELAEWLGTEKKRSGLTGELVGSDSSGNAVFVLQIDDFTVRNRVAGLNEPTPIRQEYLTRSQTELLVASAAAAKQDKLTPANAGANIAIDSNGVISNTYSLPYASTSSPGGVMLANGAEVVTGTNTGKAVTPAALKTALTGGTPFIPQEVVSSFRAITDLGNAATVSLAAGGAYKLSAISGDHYITVGSAPVGKYGDDAHLELFVGAASLVHALDPLVLMDALTPNAVNNCRIEYRDGTARMHVEDHDYGYVVTLAGGTEGTPLDGSLHYGLTGSTSAYIVFSHTTDGSTIALPDATAASRAVNIVGNGADKTFIDLGVDCRGLGTAGPLQNASDLCITGGTAWNLTMNMTNCIVKDVAAGVTGRTSSTAAIIYGRNFTGCTFEGLVKPAGEPALYNGFLCMTGGGGAMKDCVVRGCTGGILLSVGVHAFYENCLFEDHNHGRGFDIFRGTTTSIAGCTFSDFGDVCLNLFTSNSTAAGAKVILEGNTFSRPGLRKNLISVQTDAELTFTGANVLGSTVYGGGRTFVAGGTVSSPERTGMIDLKGSTAGVDLSGDVTLDGITISGLTAGTAALALQATGAPQTVRLTDCLITGNTNATGFGGGLGFGDAVGGSHVILSGCTFSGNIDSYTTANAFFVGGGILELYDVLLDSTAVPQTFLVTQSDAVDTTVLIDGMTCSPGRAALTYGSGTYSFALAVLIRAGSLNRVSTSHLNTDKFAGGDYSVVSVGSYDANGVWIAGGTASLVTNSGSTVSLSGIGSYVNADGTSDLSFTKNDWEPPALRAAIITGQELTFTGASTLVFNENMPENAIVANPVRIAAGASLNISGVSGSFGSFSHFEIAGNTIANTGFILGATVTIPANGDDCRIVYEDVNGSSVSMSISATSGTQSRTIPGRLISCSNE